MSEPKNSLETALARLSDDHFVTQAVRDVKLAFWLMQQPDVSLLAKLVPLLAVLYVLVPVDLLPDFVPLLGQIDDLALVMLGVRLFLRLAPPQVVGRYEAVTGSRSAAGGSPARSRGPAHGGGHAPDGGDLPAES